MFWLMALVMWFWRCLIFWLMALVVFLATLAGYAFSGPLQTLIIIICLIIFAKKSNNTERTWRIRAYVMSILVGLIIGNTIYFMPQLYTNMLNFIGSLKLDSSLIWR